MRISSRFSLRTLLIGVALVALTFGLAIELQNRQGRDANAAAEATGRRGVAWHERQAELCRVALAAGRPYSTRDRNQFFRRAIRTLGFPSVYTSYSGWAAEVTYHEEQARHHTEEADQAARRRRDFQRRLLWPF